ncbi:RING finger protein 122-like isoform X2 [Rhopilema esculentum]
MTTMIPSTGVHFVYRSELQRNLQAYENGLQTFVVMHSQQPCGIGQKKINQYTTITKYFSNMILLNNDSVDRLSVVSALTERTESNESCCIICLIHFKTGQEVRKLPCQHIYHINCIDKWLKMNRLCPTCRSDVTLPNSVKKPSTSNEIEVHAELNIVNNHGNRDEIINQGAVGAPSPNQSVVVSLDNSDMREADIGDDNDVTSSLASSSNGVVIEVDVEGSNTAVAN